MLLGISSDAAPDASAAELFETCRRRGLGAAEIRLADDAAVAALAAALQDGGAAGLHVSVLLDGGSLPSPALQQLCRDHGVQLVLQDAASAPRQPADPGCPVLRLHQGDPGSWVESVIASGAPVGWHIDPSVERVADALPRLLEHPGLLSYIRLEGGGPESAMQEGRGIGDLMRRLALSGYSGPLILTPSSPRYHVAWSTWLGRRGGWGCGSSTVHLLSRA